MTAIEPGEIFTIEYGREHQLEVRALGMRQQKALVYAIAEAAAAEASQDLKAIIDTTDKALEYAVGAETAEALRDEVDMEMAMEIAGKVLGKQSVSEDEKKKSESPHSSGAASSVNDAESVASEISSVA